MCELHAFTYIVLRIVICIATPDWSLQWHGHGIKFASLIGVISELRSIDAGRHLDGRVNRTIFLRFDKFSRPSMTGEAG